MSGREVSGFESALVNLFVGKNIVINNISADSEQVDHISSLYVKCGGNVINDIDCVRHDEIVTYTSQLPHVISLAYTKPINEDENKDVALISSNSFNEFSRISNINEKLWTEVFCDNAEMLVGEIDELIANLNNVKKLIAQRDKSGLDEYLIDSKNKINSVNKNKLS